MELSSCPAATVRHEGDQEGTLMYKAETLRKGRLNSYLFFSLFFPVFRWLHLHCQYHGCAHGRTVPAGEGSGTHCHTGMLLAVYPPLGPPFCPAIPPQQAFLSFPASQTQHTGGFQSKPAGCGWWLWSGTVGQRPPGLVGA